MKTILQIDERAVDAVRALDPLDHPGTRADAGLGTEAALAVVLARADSDAALASGLARSGGPTALRPRLVPAGGRRALGIGGVAVAAAAAAFVVANLASSGDGGVAPAQAETLVAKARAALVDPAGPGSIQKVVATARKGDGPAFRSETWTELDAPYNSRTVTTTAAGAAIEFGQTDGHDEFVDPATGTLYRETEPFAAQEAGGSPALAGAAEFLARPGLEVDRDASLEGTPAIKASKVNGDGSVSSYWFAKSTYEPLRFTNGEPGAAPQFVDDYQQVATQSGPAATPSDASVAAHNGLAKAVDLPNAAFVAREEAALGG
jgi:hypothetical protein